MARRVLDLHQNWTYREVEPAEVADFTARRLPELSEHGWLPAQVPGRVQLDLLEEGTLPDPFVEQNEREWFAVEKTDYVYKTSFVLPDTWQGLLGNTHDRIELCLSQLETFASVYLNGNIILRGRNEFLPLRFDISQLLKSGENVLVIQFDSPLKIATNLEREYGTLNADYDRTRVYARRSSIRTGSTVSPRLSGVGITGDVQLKHYSGLRLREPFAKLQEFDSKRAKLEIEMGMESFQDQTVELQVLIERMEPIGSGRKSKPILVADYTKTLNIKQGRFQFVQPVRIKEPAVWWPLGCADPGRRVLYRARISARIGDELCDAQTIRFGIRSVGLSKSEKDQDEFPIVINGMPIYSRGAAILPLDLLAAPITDSQCIQLVEQAAAANVNLLRVWGGGGYAPDALLERCDELGIMVWQEFAFSRGEYPEHRDFWKSVQFEVTHQVRRMRNYPSLVMWVGNDGKEALDHDLHGSWEKHQGARLFYRLIPHLITEFDGSRPYRRSTPFGGDNPNDPSIGDYHVPAKRMGVLNQLLNVEARFISKFGFDSLPGEKVTEAYNFNPDPLLQDQTTTFHDRSRMPTQELVATWAEWCRMPQTLEESTYISQWVQGKILSQAIDHWRASRPRNNGTILWHLNDTWPSVSSSIIDSSGLPKLSYWSVREAYQPISLIILPSDSGVRVVVVADHAKWDGAQPMTCRLKMYNLDGKLLNYHDEPVAVNPNGKTEVGLFSKEQLKIPAGSNCVIAGELFQGSKHIIAMRLFSFARPKDCIFPEPKVTCKLDFVLGNQRAVFLIRSKNIVRGLQIDASKIPGAIIRHENGLDMWPSREAWLQISLPNNFNSTDMLGALRYRTLNDLAPGRSIEWRPLEVEGDEKQLISSEQTGTDFDSNSVIARLRTTDVIPKLFSKDLEK